VLSRDHRDVRQFVDQRRRDQILLGVERHFRDQELVDREMTDGGAADGVAVRRAFRDLINPDIAGSAGLVLDHDGLTELVLEPLGDNAEQHVGRTARRIGNDDADRMVRPAGGGLCQGRRQAERGTCGGALHQCPARDQVLVRHRAVS
jgi:hypothetical protein